MAKAKDLKGLRVGRWKVLEQSTNKKENSRLQLWVCKCKCGALKELESRGLVNGRDSKCYVCGSKRKRKKIVVPMDRTKHTPLENTRRSWQLMKSRCSNKKSDVSPYYGERGIKYDERWEKFENFLSDMGMCPGNRTLDRIDSNKDYSKDNCRWATMLTQNRNTKRCKRWYIKGLVFESAAQAGKHFGVSDVAIHYWCVDSRKEDCYSIPLYDENGVKLKDAV